MTKIRCDLTVVDRIKPLWNYLFPKPPEEELSRSATAKSTATQKLDLSWLEKAIPNVSFGGLQEEMDCWVGYNQMNLIAHIVAKNGHTSFVHAARQTNLTLHCKELEVIDSIISKFDGKRKDVVLKASQIDFKRLFLECSQSNALITNQKLREFLNFCNYRPAVAGIRDTDDEEKSKSPSTLPSTEMEVANRDAAALLNSPNPANESAQVGELEALIVQLGAENSRLNSRTNQLEQDADRLRSELSRVLQDHQDEQVALFNAKRLTLECMMEEMNRLNAEVVKERKFSDALRRQLTDSGGLQGEYKKYKQRADTLERAYRNHLLTLRLPLPPILRGKPPPPPR